MPLSSESSSRSCTCSHCREFGTPLGSPFLQERHDEHWQLGFAIYGDPPRERYTISMRPAVADAAWCGPFDSSQLRSVVKLLALNNSERDRLAIELDESARRLDELETTVCGKRSFLGKFQRCCNELANRAARRWKSPRTRR